MGGVKQSEEPLKLAAPLLERLRKENEARVGIEPTRPFRRDEKL